MTVLVTDRGMTHTMFVIRQLTDIMYVYKSFRKSIRLLKCQTLNARHGLGR